MSTTQIKPRDLGGIIEETFKVYASNFLPLIAIAAIVEIPLLLIGLLVGPITSAEDPGYWDAGKVGLAMLGVIVISVFSFILYPLEQGAFIHAILEQYTNRQIDIIKSYAFALRRIINLLGASLLALVACAAMFITVIGIPLAIYFGVRWAFILQAVILEGKEPMAALSRSSYLVKNSWWRVFGIIIVMLLIGAVISVTLQFTIGFIPLLGDYLVAILVAPIVITCSTILYYDLVFRKEGPAVELMPEEPDQDLAPPSQL
ncbi:glycerophosphoryl diester phosphodiesterase membrane domain-containing protein [Chloroflexota bacterium]